MSSRKVQQKTLWVLNVLNLEKGFMMNKDMELMTNQIKETAIMDSVVIMKVVMADTTMDLAKVDFLVLGITALVETMVMAMEILDEDLQLMV